MSKQQRVGRAGEYLAASYLARIFDEVLTTSESSRYDFFCTSDTRNIKVQVKCTDTSFDHHGSQRVRWDIKKKVSGTKQYRLYAPEEVDLFAFVCLINQTKNLVGTSGFEPPTPTMSRWCSNQLSYGRISIYCSSTQTWID